MLHLKSPRVKFYDSSMVSKILGAADLPMPPSTFGIDQEMSDGVRLSYLEDKLEAWGLKSHHKDDQDI